MKFNKEQREGFARITDGLAVVSLSTAFAGMFGNIQIPNQNIVLLLINAASLVALGVFFRKPL